MASFDEVKLEDIVHDFFATFNPNTRANKDADSTPTIAVYEEGTSTAMTVTSSVTNVATGKYRWQINVAAADGFEAGKYYSVWATATVTGTDTVTQSVPVMSFKATARVVDDLATPTNITAGTITTVTTLTNLPAITTNWLTATGLDASAVTEIWAASTAPTAATVADAVWDEDATAHQTQGTFGQAIGDPVADTNTIFKATVTDATGATVGVDVVAIKAETVNILADTAEIGTAGAGLTNINLPNQVMDIVGNITGNLSGSVGSIATGGISAASFAAGAIDATAIATDAIGSNEISAAAVTKIQNGLATPTNITAGTITTVTNLTNAATNGDLTATMKASVNTEVDTALTDIHLDHLLATDYDPASKPGTATALLNELIGSDAGVSQFTANALELAPTGGSAPSAADIADAVWDEATSGHTTSGTFGEQVKTDIDAILDDTTTDIPALINGLNDVTAAQVATAVWQDSTAGDFTTANSVGKSLYNAFTANTSVYTVAALANAPTGGSAPTAADIADAVWDEAIAGHATAGSTGKTVADILVDTAEIGTAGAGLTNINLPDQVMNVTGNITGNVSGSVGSVATGGISSASFASGAINAAAIATDAIGSAEISAAAVTKIQAGLATPTNITAGTITTVTNVTNLTNAATNGDLTATMKASVNAEVLDVMNVDTFAELAAPPAATSSLRAKLTWLFMWARNRSNETATARKLYADDATTVVSTEVVSDDGTTFEKGEAS